MVEQKVNQVDTDRIRPIGSVALIRIHPRETVSKGGIHIATTVPQKTQYATVLAVGKGRWVGEKLIPLPYKKGDVIIFESWAQEQISKLDDDHVLIPFEHVLAIVR